MGRVASSADNAAMESFFTLLQKNALNTRRWETREQLRLAIVTWIERTYHRRRRQRALGKTTPTEFETIYWPARGLKHHTRSVNQTFSSPLLRRRPLRTRPFMTCRGRRACQC